VRVFESIVTGLEDILCFATADTGAFDLFSGRGMASDSYPILAIKEYANPVRVGLGSPRRVRARHKTTAPEFRCFEPSSAQEVEQIEERLRSD
jgi:hypothetical protein